MRTRHISYANISWYRTTQPADAGVFTHVEKDEIPQLFALTHLSLLRKLSSTIPSTHPHPLADSCCSYLHKCRYEERVDIGGGMLLANGGGHAGGLDVPYKLVKYFPRSSSPPCPCLLLSLHITLNSCTHVHEHEHEHEHEYVQVQVQV